MHKTTMGSEFERWVELTDTYAGLLDDKQPDQNRQRSVELAKLARDLIAHLKRELGGSQEHRH